MFPFAESLQLAAATVALAGAEVTKEVTKDVQGRLFAREMRQYKPYHMNPGQAAFTRRVVLDAARQELARTEVRRMELERFGGERYRDEIEQLKRTEAKLRERLDRLEGKAKPADDR